MRSGSTRGVRGGLAVLALLVLPGRVVAATATTADDLCVPSADPCVVSTPFEIADEAVIDVGTRELRIALGGALDGFGGMMTIVAGRLTVEVGGFVRSTPRSATTTAGGSIHVTAGSIAVAGEIEAGGAPGGTIQLDTSGILTVTGEVSVVSKARDNVGGSMWINAGTAVLTGELLAFGGTDDGLGGDIAIDVLGTAAVDGIVDGSGGDGGTVDIEAGARGGEGDLTIGEHAVIKADATASGGFGGEVELAANGDGIATGNVSLAGTVSSVGKGSTEGGSGGSISITAKGTIRNDAAEARVVADGGGFDGDGGEIDVSAEGGLSVQGTFGASATGEEGGAGSITFDVVGDAVIGGTLAIASGNGGNGEITVSSAEGSVEITSTGVLDGRAQSGGTGGSICLESGNAPDGLQSVLVAGRILLDGGGNGGTGGSAELSGGDSVRITGTVRAPGARGGIIAVTVDAGPALIESPLDVSGVGTTGVGGTVSIDAESRVSVNAVINARGPGGGGEVGISSTGPVDILEDVRVSATGTGPGGGIEVVSQGNVMIARGLIVDGFGGAGGRTEVTGCTVTVCGQDSPGCPAGGVGVMSALGPGGTNRIVGRDIAVVLGTMRADEDSGRNELVYDGNPNREPLVSGEVTPEARVIVDPGVAPCPGCGNGVIEPPETCDEGDQLDGDGCSASCQVEAPIVGDVNGDYVLSIDDVRFLVAEIFDGDGDSVGMVSGGGFAGGPGADANGDGRITAADIPAIIGILAAQ